MERGRSHRSLPGRGCCPSLEQLSILHGLLQASTENHTLDQHTSVELRGLSYPVRHEGLPRQSGTQTNHKPFHLLGLPRFQNHGYGVRAGFLSTIMGPPFILLRSRPFCDSS